MCIKISLILVVGTLCAICKTDKPLPNTLVITVASNLTDGYLQYLRTARINGISVRTLGMYQPWTGGTMMTTGGGQKINLLRKELVQVKDDSETIVLFTDSYDVIFLAGIEDIVERFLESGARVLFGAESFCWPDKNLASKYPAVARGKQYLNSGTYIGYANDIFAILSYRDIADSEDDQLYFTKVYLDEEMRSKHKLQLDHKSALFQNLNGAIEEVDVQWSNQEAYLVNSATNTRPAVLHGNGLSKVQFNTLANYLARAWTAAEGCVACKEDTLKLDDNKKSSWPRVLLSVFISRPTPFLEEFIETLRLLEYPRDRLDMFVYNGVEKHETAVDSLVEAMRTRVRSVKRIHYADDIADVKAHELALDYFQKKDSELFFSVDSEARLDNPLTLKLLVEQNRRVIAPLLIRPYKAWSNFWGSISEDGYYARSVDYMDIVNSKKRGVWNVPHIASCYLMNATVINNPATRPSYTNAQHDSDMAFSINNRNNGVFMYVTNRVDFGHLIDLDDFSLDNLHPELYNIFQNEWDWRRRYIHENYSQNLESEEDPLQPCPDVYWFPVASTRFCDELVATMENFGKWSDGSNKDERLGGGYEAVPTRDIHMSQVGLEKQWLHFLKLFVLPVNQRVFLGYADADPRSIMNFVVRYRPDEQPSLRPHHDSSTYTINLALNTPHLDYQGGGCKFLRYNCSVTNMRKGWMLMHPGRLTHYHEGLTVTGGTRYIMISFIDP